MSFTFLFYFKFAWTILQDERDNAYYFFLANQQKAGTKIYSLTQCSLSVNECDWHILEGNDKRINTHCLTRKVEINLELKFQVIIFFIKTHFKWRWNKNMADSILLCWQIEQTSC